MPKTVLIAEDYTDVRAIMKILVRKYGYEVIEAGDGFEAVEKTEQHRPDLILMDLAMPIMDGLTATKIIRESKGLTNIPIVALTAYGNNYFKEAVEAGVDEIINKPLEFDSLEPLLHQYLA
jgi:CheY-like chemotaxis protein